MQPSSVPAPIALSAISLFKRFGSLVAVNDLSLDVRRGSCVGLLGPNGAGKSTTLSLLAGLEHPDGGSVSVLGERDPTRHEVRRHLGFVPQQIALYPELTVSENLEFFGRAHGLRRAVLRERIDEALELACLLPRRGALVATLSGGMQRRLNLVCATLHRPPVLLLDEPSVGVDQASRAAFADCIQALKQRGTALVYCTHQLDEAEQLCDELALVDQGRVVARGSPGELRARHGGEHMVRARMDAGSARRRGLEVSDDGWLSVACSDVRRGLEHLLGLGLPLLEVSVERARLEHVLASLQEQARADAVADSGLRRVAPLEPRASGASAR